MRNYYIGIAVLILFSIILAGILFSIVGSPITQRAKQLDQTRLSDFSSLQTSIQEYYTSNKSLPASLNELHSYYSYVKINDPETHKRYDYKVKSSTSYELCTTFSTKGKSGQTGLYPAFQQPTKHKKGYDCLTYTIPPYLVPTPYNSYHSYHYQAPFTPTSTIAPVPKTAITTTTDNTASQANFTKFNSESAIIAPTQGAVLCSGKKYTIKWRVPADDTQGITLYIGLPSDGNTIHTIGSFPGTYNTNKPGYGSYTWVVGNTTDSTTLGPSAAYHIFLKGVYKGWELTKDSSLFTIKTCS